MSPAVVETSPAPHRPAAPPWQVVTGSGKVEAAWEQLRWREDEIPARALTLNLVCRAQDANDAERLAGWAWALGPGHPARVFVISPGDGTTTLRVAADPDGSELVEIACPPERASSLAAPLLIGDLSTLLLWHCERPAGGSKFEGWSELADRILVDSHRMRVNARELANLATGLRAGCWLSDLTWTRLTPWRQLLCQGLESESGAYRQIASVSIMAGHGRSLPAGEGWRPEASLAAILLVGWMSQQLGWQWESVQSSCALTGARAGGKRVEVEFAPCPPQERHG
ncbi:MAG: glucose-6-phosphate dehydrogenase assembly protein OpcA, partial [Terriglobales bacterium]